MNMKEPSFLLCSQASQKEPEAGCRPLIITESLEETRPNFWMKVLGSKSVERAVSADSRLLLRFGV